MSKSRKIRILGINGSPSKTGQTAKLLMKCLKSAEKTGATTQIMHLIDKEHSLFHSHLSRWPEKDFRKTEKMLLNADGFVLATPVHWMNISVLMKNFIDKLTFLEERGFVLEGKVAGFIACEAEGGGWEAAMLMAAPLNHMGVLTPPYSTLFYNPNLKDTKVSKWMKKDVELLGKNIVTMCEIVKEKKPNWDYGKKFLK